MIFGIGLHNKISVLFTEIFKHIKQTIFTNDIITVPTKKFEFPHGATLSLYTLTIKARLHWRFCSAFSSDVFAIDVHVFCHRYKFKQGKFNGKPWGDAVWKIEKVLFFKTSRPKVHGFACLGCHIHPWRQT